MLGQEDATDTLASLRVIHNNLQLILLRAQQDMETETEVETATASNNGSTVELGVSQGA